MTEMINRRPGEYPPFETRAEANETVNRQERYRQIVECLREKPNQTAKELASSMLAKRFIPYCDRNFTAPRLTELTQKGVVEPVGKRVCKWTGKMVTVYNLREGGAEWQTGECSQKR